ncbi:MAG: hypothetical protein KY459_03205 [Acidobacteria bacterium]|nr:hypothetical protein [Acidobacteriota bacterium]
MIEHELVDAVESLTIDPAAFDHETHIRFAWTLLRDDPDGARERISIGIRRLAAHADAPKKYDEALTLNWISRISEHLRPDEDWSSFRRRAEDLFAK